MEWRSRRLGIGHLLDPLLEDRPGVVRPRSGLRMELHRARVLQREVETLDSAVIERNVDRLPCFRGCDCEAVVLAGDQHAPGGAVEHRVVRTTVPEGELERLMSGREGEQLV